LLSAKVDTIDAVLFTHDHADHTHGIDELRQVYFKNKKTIELYSDAGTIDSLCRRFSYLFQGNTTGGDMPRPSPYPVIFDPKIIQGSFWVGKTPVFAFPQHHGYSTTLGYRFGKFAYSTDVLDLPAEAFKVLEGVEIWIVDCLSLAPGKTHSYLDKTLQWIKQVQPKRALLTHMNNSLDYDTLCSLLPEGVEPAYDGLEIIVEE
jgi:phosphoribosyl 1,2-cyclic phosphate phosphodiesterase